MPEKYNIYGERISGFEEEPQYIDIITDPAIITASLPAKFRGSQAAARRYADAYHWANDNVVQPRERFAERISPYVLGLAGGPSGAIAAIAGESINNGINIVTDADKNTWGDLFVSPEKHPVWNSIVNITNPGYLLLGPIESGLRRQVNSATIGERMRAMRSQQISSRVEKALDKIKGKIDSEELSQLGEVADDFKIRLSDEGVRKELLTDDNLRLLMRSRAESLMGSADSAPGRFVLRSAPGEGGYQFYTAFERGYPSARTDWPQNAIGYIGIEPTRFGYPGVQMVENVTPIGANGRRAASGVSETLYNAVIQDKGHLVSGQKLHHPEITFDKILPKYQKTLLDNSGQWGTGWQNLTDGHPVYHLDAPTKPETLKYIDDFSTKVISPEGKFIVDWSAGPTMKNGGLLNRLSKHYNGDRSKIIQAMQYARGGFKRDAATDAGDQYYDIVRQRRNSAFNALLRAGMSPDDAARLAPMIVTQQTMEGGWVLNRKDNNYGGMKSAGKTIAFDSEDDFQDAYIKMLDSKWHNGRAVENSWRSARDLDDWARILNREDLGLDTKEAWEKYNRGKQGDDFVYLYAPQWENNNKPYREHLKKTEDRAAAYLKMVDAEEPYSSLVPKQEQPVSPIATSKKTTTMPGMFQALIPTSVQKLLNGKAAGGLLLKDYASGGSIHIAPSKKGTFTAAAKKHGKSVQAFASQVLANKENYSPAMVKKANFARNFGGHKHGNGGLIERYGVDKVRAAMQKVKR